MKYKKLAVISLVLTVLMLSIGFPLRSEAAVKGKVPQFGSQTSNAVQKKIVKYGDFEFDIEKAEIVKYLGKGGNVKIPSKIKGVKVLSIGKRSFVNCKELTNVSIPSTVVYIGEAAFSGTGLKSIKIPNSVRAMGIGVFIGCLDLEEVVLPKYIESLSDMFCGCGSLVEIDIPDGVTNIDDAFINCTSLFKIKLPGSITSMENSFSGCINLNNAELAEGIVRIGETAFGGCISLEEIVVPKSLYSIGDMAFDGCSNFRAAYFQGDAPTSIGNDILLGVPADFTIYYTPTSIGFPPPTWNGYKTEMIGEKVDYLVDAEKGEILKYDGPGGFVEIPEKINDVKIVSIGVGAFAGCKELKNVEIPDSVVSIGKGAFSASGLTSVKIPDSVKTIDEGAFVGCYDLTEVVLPKYIESISGVFCACQSLTTIDIPEGVKNINWAFPSCTSLTSVKIPGTVTSMENAFSGCSKLTSVEMGEGIARIGMSEFGGCQSLKEITIPSTVVSLGDGAFDCCCSLDAVYFKGNAPAEVGSGVFEGVSPEFIIFFNSAGIGIATPTWNGYKTEFIK